MNDLARLIEAVEGGFAQNTHFDAIDGAGYYANAIHAYHGSLDAAKALHEALLPGWGWEVGVNSAIRNIAQVWESGRDKAFPAANYTPARAWLLAVLKAYRSLQ